MPRKPPPECILILLDVGKNMNELASNDEEQCLKISKDCTMQILLRKLFSESTDEFALITFGSETTNNALADANGYRGIDAKSDRFSIVNPEIVKEVENLEVNPNGVGDWLDAIVVATHFINENMKDRVFSAHKIVLFSNFNNSVNGDQVDVITRKVKDMGIELTVIGPDIRANIADGEQAPESQEVDLLISTMVDELGGSLCSFREAYTELETLSKKAAKPMPWNSMLHISSKIKIPIRAFKKIAKPKALKWISGIIDDDYGLVDKVKSYQKFEEGNPIPIEVPKDELIDAFLFGTTIVPFSDIDKESMTYKSGAKGLYLVGCTYRETVPRHILMGEGSYVIVARQDDNVGNHMLQCLVQAMHKSQIVGIARRVYTDNSSANLGVLAPYITPKSRYLVFVQLPYAEDEHVYRFPSLDKTPLERDELMAAFDLVEAMDLDDLGGGEDLYDVTRLYDPHEQYKLKCLGYKFVHPDKEIPEEIMKDIARALQPKPAIVEMSKAALQGIKEKFPIEKVVKKVKGKFNRESNDPSTSGISGGTLFQNANLNVDDTSSPSEYQTMQQTVENIVKTNPEDMGQFLDALKSVREKCLQKDPNVYNKWIPQLKDSLKEQNLIRLWNTIIDENLGIISKSESPLSNADDQMVDEFLKVGANDFKSEDADSVYGSMNTESNDDWLDDM